MLTAIVATIGILGPAPGATMADNSPCSLSNPDGILSDVGGVDRPYDELEVALGETRTFPPGTKCLLYGRNYSGSGASYTPSPRQLIAYRFYPEATSYIWLLVLIISPVLLVLATRLLRYGYRRLR